MSVVRALRGWAGDVVVAAVAAAVIGGAAWRGAGGASGVELLPAEVALGTVAEGEEPVVRLTVSNRGPAEVRAVVMPSCACMTPDVGPLIVPAFSNATFAVRVATARRPGFNVAHVQIASTEGGHLAQSMVTFTVVTPYVFEPAVLFLRGGEESGGVIAHCLASEPPDALLASSDEPALVARVERRGPRTWRIGCELEGTPSRRLASVRVLERRAGGEATAGIVTVSLPTSRVGEVRMSGDAEPVAGGLARAWLLIATEASRAMRVRSLRARSGSDPAWRQEYADDAHGSHLWIECTYPRTAAHDVVDLDVEVGSRTERISAVLPPLRDGGTASGGPGR